MRRLWLHCRTNIIWSTTLVRAPFSWSMVCTHAWPWSSSMTKFDFHCWFGGLFVTSWFPFFSFPLYLSLSLFSTSFSVRLSLSPVMNLIPLLISISLSKCIHNTSISPLSFLSFLGVSAETAFYSTFLSSLGLPLELRVLGFAFLCPVVPTLPYYLSPFLVGLLS